MIATRTPYRVSFAGGGTDLPAFCDVEPGLVISTAIDQYIYVQISPRRERNWLIRAGTGSQEADEIDNIHHGIIRECLRLHGIKDGLEIVVTGEVPGGTGLGSSSSLTVGLLAALDRLRGRETRAKALAQQACLVEMGILKKPIGYQDAYAAAFGGLNAISFKAKGNVWVEPLQASQAAIAEIERHILIVQVSTKPRDADTILARQSAETGLHMNTLREMVANARDAQDAILKGDVHALAWLIAQGWHLKRSLGCGITNGLVDGLYDRALEAGAWGGKLLGAGTSGFMLLIAPPELHPKIRMALGSPLELPFRMVNRGTEIIYDSEAKS